MTVVLILAWLTCLSLWLWAIAWLLALTGHWFGLAVFRLIGHRGAAWLGIIDEDR